MIVDPQEEIGIVGMQRVGSKVSDCAQVIQLLVTSSKQ
jgi:lactate dehydrogenase-like 2-hydroxyacid dehydrogenase